MFRIEDFQILAVDNEHGCVLALLKRRKAKIERELKKLYIIRNCPNVLQGRTPYQISRREQEIKSIENAEEVLLMDRKVKSKRARMKIVK